MAIGRRDTSSLVMLTGWDATELQNFQLEDGTTYAQIVASLNAALAALNAEFSNDFYATMYSVTDQPDLEYRVGVSNGFGVHTEYGRPDARRAATEGHMLPLIAYDRMLGWTWDYLQEARMEQIDADIADGIKDARDRRRLSILTRVLRRDDDSGAANGLGSSGYSPGFATTAASTSVDFTPPAYGGTTFASTHEHYVAIAGGVFTNAVFTDIQDELREHGHEPPYTVIIGPSDQGTVEALSNFTPVAEVNVRYGDTQDLSTLGTLAIDGVGTYPIGSISNCSVYVVRGVPQYYGWGFKSYGRLSQRNPLRIRLKKGESAFRIVAMTQPESSGITPLQNLMLYTKFGVGVSDRTNGTSRYVNNSTWSNGTAT